MDDDSKRRFSGIYKIYRKLRYLNHRGTLISANHKIKEKPRFNRRKIRYRKLRYLISTGRLFRIDRGKILTYLDQKIFFAVNKKNLIITVNSTALFLLAYFFVYLSKQLAVGLAANSLNIPAALFYFDVDFLIRSTEWTPDAVKIIFSVGPLITLLMTVLSLILYLNKIDRTSVIRTFILWVFCHSIIQFLGEIMVGTLMNQGFGWVLMYLYFPDTAKMIVTILSVVFLAVAGLFFSGNFLFTANTYYNYLTGRTRNKFVFSQVVLPFLLGNIIIMLIKTPGMTTLEMLINCSMILLLLPAIIRSRYSNELFFDEEPRKIRLYWAYIAAVLIIIPVYRIIFGAGISI